MKDADKPRRGPGQPPFEPTSEQRLFVQMMAANGTPQDVIARNLPLGRGQRGIAEKTLRKAFREELDSGYADTLARMGSTVVREGLKGQGWAVRYWLDRRGGPEWKPTENVLPPRRDLQNPASTWGRRSENCPS